MTSLIKGVVVYDPSVWSEFGFTVQRYIASSVNIGIRGFAVIVGIGLVANIIRWLLRM